MSQAHFSRVLTPISWAIIYSGVVIEPEYLRLKVKKDLDVKKREEDYPKSVVDEEGKTGKH